MKPEMLRIRIRIRIHVSQSYSYLFCAESVWCVSNMSTYIYVCTHKYAYPCNVPPPEAQHASFPAIAITVSLLL